MTKTEKEIVEEILNDLITERWVKPEWLQYKDEIISYIQRILNQGRKQLAEEIADMSCHDAPEVCQCCLELNEKLQKEAD